MPPHNCYAVIWAPCARQDLEDIATQIAEDDFAVSLDVLARLEHRASTLVFFPDRGRIVPELRHQGLGQYRELIEAPWRILYKITGQIVNVMAVVDGRRNFEDVLLFRSMRD